MLLTQCVFFVQCSECQRGEPGVKLLEKDQCTSDFQKFLAVAAASTCAVRMLTIFCTSEFRQVKGPVDEGSG